MRVTDRMLHDRVSQDGGATRSRLEVATARASTGVKLVHPGDGPAAAGQVVSERVHQGQFDAIAITAGRASEELTTADAALSDLDTAVSRARELAVQLSSDQYSASDRVAGAEEVKGLLSTVISRLNAKVGDRYVLGGTQDSRAPFDGIVYDASGDVDTAMTGTYRGDAAVRQVEIAPGVQQDASVRADVAVKGAGTPPGVDLLATLGMLHNTLMADDPTAVGATLDGLTQGTSQLATARGKIGAAMSTLDAAVTANQAARHDARKRIAGLTDVDAIEAASDLSLAQHALEASLTATSQSFKFTLLDKLT